MRGGRGASSMDRVEGGLGESENGEGWGEHPAVVVYRASGIQFPVYCAGPISAVCCALRPL